MSSGHGGSEKASCELTAANVARTRKNRRPLPRTPNAPGAEADLDSEFRDAAAADETTSLLHRREAAPSRFDTGQFSFRDAAQ